MNRRRKTTVRVRGREEMVVEEYEEGMIRHVRPLGREDRGTIFRNGTGSRPDHEKGAEKKCGEYSSIDIEQEQ
ncbi:hypothetical protein GWI33_011501 [Rhynchophorus ferrugineus]|uniref:Uncharacterized protein n=1 Tax=Rhynchophorus ferrugineus TaxID=354439 RepID=A0A834MD67_RHYFE|nr:hypothetical protein GWI33_011501 [Rhynchophorus ferrugineus]